MINYFSFSLRNKKTFISCIFKENYEFTIVFKLTKSLKTDFQLNCQRCVWFPGISKHINLCVFV